MCYQGPVIASAGRRRRNAILIPSSVSYADDTAVVTSAKTWKEVETKMNETLHKISTWLAHNKLSLNTDKTVYIEFWNQADSTSKNLDISIQGTKIKELIVPNI